MLSSCKFRQLTFDFRQLQGLTQTADQIPSIMTTESDYSFSRKRRCPTQSPARYFFQQTSKSEQALSLQDLDWQAKSSFWNFGALSNVPSDNAIQHQRPPWFVKTVNSLTPQGGTKEHDRVGLHMDALLLGLLAPTRRHMG
jgi:hypothetical protein